ncbi:MAG: hypothetical protein WBG71_06205, partial [Leeuwenhoekiella sp.]
MLAYLFKSALCILVLWSFYKLALEQTAAHHFKRFYLLGSLVLALTLPLITLSYTVEMPAPEVVESPAYYPEANFTASPTVAIEEPIDYTSYIIGTIYAIGFFVFGFRFAKNIRAIHKKVKDNEKIPAHNYINVLLTGKIVPHSFLKYIFLPITDFKQNQIAPEILAHEKAHVHQKHSWDILLIEFLQV